MEDQSVNSEKSFKSALARLWNLNFVLLWQGQFVSAIGDVMYAIALGFWILNRTGSTALMGSLMAVSTIPRIVIAPFAGVFVDRTNRKTVLIGMDVIRGIIVTFIGIAAYAEFIQVWMVFAAGVIISFCGAFFTPAVLSSIPDIISKERTVQANSALSTIYTSSGIVGNSAGGFLFKLLGAPFMFLFNGLSYLFSSIMLFFVKIPRIIHPHEPQHFLADMKDGFSFIWKFRGLRTMVILAFLMNFFANIGIMLFVPLFQQHKHLGPGLYGLAMAFYTGGMFLGYVLTSAFKVPPEKRYEIFLYSATVGCLAVIGIPLTLIFPIMAALAIIGGLSGSVVNSLILGVMQLTTPQHQRGKVFAFLGSMTQGAVPIAYAVGGVLAEFFSVRSVIAVSFLINLIVFLALAWNNSWKGYVNYDPDKNTIEEIM